MTPPGLVAQGLWPPLCSAPALPGVRLGQKPAEKGKRGSGAQPDQRGHRMRQDPCGFFTTAPSWLGSTRICLVGCLDGVKSRPLGIVFPRD